MRFLLIVHAPNPVTGLRKPTTERFREVLGNALLAEELGFDGFGVGERHERPFISSSPPQQVIQKVRRYHEQFGHSVLHLHADADGLTDTQHRASIELFQAEIAPVLRREIPDPPWPWGPVASKPAAGAPATGRAPAVPAGAD